MSLHNLNRQLPVERRETFTEFQILKYLDKLHITATGLDKLPAWFLRLGALVFASSDMQPIQQIIEWIDCA